MNEVSFIIRRVSSKGTFRKGRVRSRPASLAPGLSQRNGCPTAGGLWAIGVGHQRRLSPFDSSDSSGNQCRWRPPAVSFAEWFTKVTPVEN